MLHSVLPAVATANTLDVSAIRSRAWLQHSHPYQVSGKVYKSCLIFLMVNTTRSPEKKLLPWEWAVNNLLGAAAFRFEKCPPTPHNECQVRTLRTGTSRIRKLCRPPVTHTSCSSTTLGTVVGLRDFPSRETQITHDQASAGDVENQDNRVREPWQVSKDNEAVEKVAFLNIWKKRW